MAGDPTNRGGERRLSLASKPGRRVTAAISGADMSDCRIVNTQAETIGACSLCGHKNPATLGYRRKVSWLKERYAEGLRYKQICSAKLGDLGMIEYTLGDQAWRPVDAKGYLVIHCLWVHGQHQAKGLGSRLLRSCFEDARKNGCYGVAAVTSSDSFMAGSDVFLKAGFSLVDRTIGSSDASTAPYELLVKKLKTTAPDPRFVIATPGWIRRYHKGLTILTADQCPYATQSAERIAEACRTLGLKPRVVRIRSAQASRELPSPYGVFSILYEGHLIAHRPISATRFLSVMRKHLERRPGPNRSPVAKRQRA